MGEYGIVYEIAALASSEHKPTSRRWADDDQLLVGEHILEDHHAYGGAEVVPIEIKTPLHSRTATPRLPSSVSKSSVRTATRAGDPDDDGDDDNPKHPRVSEQLLIDSRQKPPRSNSVATAPNLPRQIFTMDASSPLIPPKSIVIVPPPLNSNNIATTNTTIDSIPDTPLQASERKHRRGDSRSSMSLASPIRGGEFSSENNSRVMTASDDTGNGTFALPSRSSGNLSDNVSDFDELTDDSDDDDDKNRFRATVDEIQLRMCGHVHRDGRPRYAVKRLKENLPERVRVDAAIDLACEAEFLKRISHSNIVRLRAVVGQPGTLEYALVLDRLTQTLTEKLVVWRTRVKECRGKWGWLGRDNEKLDRMLTDRLLLSFDIARAMQHIHKQNICYRDLKPENAGFNLRGDIKLFDFGLAKELKHRDLREPPDGFEATGLTGSRRYMAPEVVCCELYGYSADVYSFAILFWEIMALKTPFPDFDTNKHFDQVVKRHKRPGRLSELPSQVQSMMEDAWSAQRMRRPTFRQINQILLAAITDRVGMSADVVSDRSAFLIDRSIRSMYGDERLPAD